jgi:nitroimidazol reductase NimA-like FMN-containing flavoprotein (pyridoxamine 5'-phosphate oxidase superfamily)
MMSVVQLDRNGLEVLDEAACLALLRTTTIGRVAITVGALPTILPVNYRFVDGAILFRTGVGTKLAAATAGDVVAFEVDHIEPMSHAGWSVVVLGIARRITDPARLELVDPTSIPRWAPNGLPSHVVEIVPSTITGRRIGVGVHAS